MYSELMADISASSNPVSLNRLVTLYFTFWQLVVNQSAVYDIMFDTFVNDGLILLSSVPLPLGGRQGGLVAYGYLICQRESMSAIML